MSPIDVKAADDNRDSLAKTLYQRLFDWLVDKINSSIGQDPSAATLVGVLDIYGTKPHQPLLAVCCSLQWKWHTLSPIDTPLDLVSSSSNADLESLQLVWYSS